MHPPIALLFLFLLPATISFKHSYLPQRQPQRALHTASFSSDFESTSSLSRSSNPSSNNPQTSLKTSIGGNAGFVVIRDDDDEPETFRYGSEEKDEGSSFRVNLDFRLPSGLILGDSYDPSLFLDVSTRAFIQRDADALKNDKNIVEVPRDVKGGETLT